MSQDPVYKNINLIVRPLRCAILINEESVHWRAAVTGAIAAASEVWGGRSFLIIPTDGKRIKKKFWEMLEAFSPDRIAEYRLTFLDTELSQPDEYVKTKAKLRRDWDTKNVAADFDEWFTERSAMSPIDKLVISDDLNDQLLNRLSPFHSNGMAIQDHLARALGFNFPYTKVASIIPYVVGNFNDAVLPMQVKDPDTAILLHSQSGVDSESYCEELVAQNVSVSQLSDRADVISLIERLFRRRPLAAPMFGGQRISDHLISRLPFSLSMLQIGEYYDMRLHLEYKEPVTVILGDTVDDFCLYYSLSRLHRDVFWLPLRWLRETYRIYAANKKRYAQQQELQKIDTRQRLTSLVVDLLYDRIKHGSGEKYVQVLSMSLNSRQLAAYRREIIECCLLQSDDFASKIRCEPIETKVTACVMRAFEIDNYANHQSVVFIDGQSVSPLNTPKPKNFSQVLPSGHYWITSLQIEDYVPPPLAALGTSMIDIHGVPLGSRVANDGIAYHSQNMAYFGGGIDVNLVKPKIRMPDEMALMGAYFDLIGVTIQYSDKGRYLADTLRRFGSLDEAASFIKATSTRQILEKFMTDRGSNDGTVIFLQNDQRAYLSFGAFKQSIGDKVQAATLIDDLINKKVLERGYIFRCERCRLSSWYSIDVLTSDFICTRCSLRQQFTHFHWKQPAEANWYYRLAETIYQCYFHHSHVTIQALHRLKSRAKVAFHHIPEIELLGFPQPGQKHEIDIACILDGKIILGECKTEEFKPKDASKFETLARMLVKPPDAIVFATNLRSVSKQFKLRISGLPGSEVLTYDALYN